MTNQRQAGEPVAWLISGGEHGEREDFNIENGIASVSWDELPDLSEVSSREELNAMIRGLMYDAAESQIAAYTVHAWTLRAEVRRDDWVIMPRKGTSQFALGIANSEYWYWHAERYHVISVDWKCIDVPYEVVQHDLSLSIDVNVHICSIPCDDVAWRLQQLLLLGKDPGARTASDSGSVDYDIYPTFIDDNSTDIADTTDINQYATDTIPTDRAAAFTDFPVTDAMPTDFPASDMTLSPTDLPTTNAMSADVDTPSVDVDAMPVDVDTRSVDVDAMPVDVDIPSVGVDAMHTDVGMTPADVDAVPTDCETSETTPTGNYTTANDMTDFPESSFDLEKLGMDQIRAFVANNFSGRELNRIVIEILRAEGFFAEESPQGLDGGIDIFAGSGLLGLDSPHMVVQINSDPSPVDVKIIREFYGVLSSHGAKQALLVAWGGITHSTVQELSNQFFQIRVWDADDLIKAMLRNYDKLSKDLRTDLPLKRIWSLDDQ